MKETKWMFVMKWFIITLIAVLAWVFFTEFYPAGANTWNYNETKFEHE